MKIFEIIDRLDKSDQNSTSVDIQDIASEFGLSYYGWDNEAEEAAKAYWITKWNCTDTWVGCRAIFLNDCFIGTVMQTARKNSKEYYFVSEIRAKMMKDFIIDLMTKEEMGRIAFLDPNVEYDEFYTMSYTNDVLDKKAWYQDEEVEIVHSRWTGYSESTILVKKPDGVQITVHVKDLKFRIGIK